MLLYSQQLVVKDKQFLKTGGRFYDEEGYKDYISAVIYVHAAEYVL